MKPSSRFFLFRFLVALVAVLLFLSPAFAIELNFDRFTYEAAPGDTIDLVVAFDQPVPNGLDAYGLRLTFPHAALALTEADIVVVSELDNDLFAENDADRSVGAGTATVQGFADFTDGPYHGAALATFSVTVPVNAPLGSHTLELGLADPAGNNFVDGEMESIDAQIVFGTATLAISETDASPVRVEEISRNAATGHIELRFSGSPGATYTIEVSTDLKDWSPLSTVTAEPDGSFDYTDEAAALLPRRFYRAGP